LQRRYDRAAERPAFCAKQFTASLKFGLTSLFFRETYKPSEAPTCASKPINAPVPDFDYCAALLKRNLSSRPFFYHRKSPLPLLDVPHLPLAAGAFTSLLLCLMIVFTHRWHGQWSLDHTTGVQKIHTQPTPRIGGVAVMVGGVVGWWLAPSLVNDVLLMILIASLPAFAFGLAEDLTRKVGVRERLLATMASGVLAWWLSGVSLTRVDVWGIDAMLAWAPLSVIFTAFAVGGIANAINIIDGFNGLAAGVILICLSSLGFIAFLAGDPVMAKVCFVLGGVTTGFLVINFPFGKIFLGDGGAYLLGFWLAWIAVLIAMRNPHISPWSSLLACAYPIVEVLFSVYRRRRRNHHAGHPDRLHLHSLIKSRITRKRMPNSSLTMKNAAVSPYLWCLAAVPALLAPVLRNHTSWLMLAFVGFFALYYSCYVALVRFAIRR
jgi:UDP-N-acetylmuramyl pentapeptide phosphotransferase/UDP-N-acetylglucosamine-1-phosphate transferase